MFLRRRFALGRALTFFCADFRYTVWTAGGCERDRCVHRSDVFTESDGKLPVAARGRQNIRGDPETMENCPRGDVWSHICSIIIHAGREVA